jgi:hypothetical protein
MEWDLYTMYKLCGDWKTILIDFSPELIPACMSQNQRPQAQHNAGGSNGWRTRLWKAEPQRLANALGRTIAVCHLPPGTSKWNKIEHRMFAHITQNWRGRPLISHEVIINLIGHTTTKTGLRIRAELDTQSYPTGRKITDEEFAQIQIER